MSDSGQELIQLSIRYQTSDIKHPTFIAMPLTLGYFGETRLPVEIEGLTPDWAFDKRLAEIERFEIFHGNEKLALAELFAVSGDAGDKQLDFEGDLPGVHWIGAHMRSGHIRVHGSAGRHLGSEMRGGEIHVTGKAGGWVGCEMRGGLIHVGGSAGDLVGAAYRGSARGMAGGTIMVKGDAGNELGLRMKEGTIVVAGSVGDMIGFNMSGGLITVFGECGVRPGAGMTGGTIGLFGPTRPALLPSFRYDRPSERGTFATPLQRLHASGISPVAPSVPAEADVYVGDLIVEGHGEIYLCHSV
jgi:formylmethanofuran dehydrogenase subunit C